MADDREDSSGRKDDNVIRFPGATTLNLDPDEILKANIGTLDGFVLCGYTKEGEEFFGSTYADPATANWLLDRCKQAIFNADHPGPADYTGDEQP